MIDTTDCLIWSASGLGFGASFVRAFTNDLNEYLKDYSHNRYLSTFFHDNEELVKKDNNFVSKYFEADKTLPI